MSQSALNKLRVLFVDDEAAIRDVMRIELPRMGHETTICEDGQAAIAAIEKNTFDVAIVDLRMPGIDGLETTRRLKAALPSVPVVLYTAYLDPAIERAAREAGATVCLTKVDGLPLLERELLSATLERRVALRPADKL